MTEFNDKLRWGILGTSFISSIIVDAIRNSDHGVVSCVAGRTESTLQDFCSKHNILRSYTDYDRLLEEEDLDVIYIGLPTFMHASYIKKCSQAKKHVLCEKSLTLNYNEAVDALQAAESSGIFCMEAQMYRCHPIISQLKKCLEDNTIGAPSKVIAEFNAPIVDLFNRVAGGSIIDLGCYPISLVRYLFGEPISVTGSSTLVEPVEEKRAIHSSFDISSHAILQLQSEVTAEVSTTNNGPLFWNFVIYCQSGTLSLSNLWDESSPPTITISHNDGGEVEHIVVTTEKNFYTLQIEAVHRFIKEGRSEAVSPAMNHTDSLGNMCVLDQWRAASGLRYLMEAALHETHEAVPDSSRELK
jgi:predicted dehydrogenase